MEAPQIQHPACVTVLITSLDLAVEEVSALRAGREHRTMHLDDLQIGLNLKPFRPVLYLNYSTQSACSSLGLPVYTIYSVGHDINLRMFLIICLFSLSTDLSEWRDTQCQNLYMQMYGWL